MQTFCCKGCGHVLGAHDHRRFVAGGSEFAHAIPIKCTKCGQTTNWRPTPSVIEVLKEKARERK